jgi:hypothetical protein
VSEGKALLMYWAVELFGPAWELDGSSRSTALDPEQEEAVSKVFAAAHSAIACGEDRATVRAEVSRIYTDLRDGMRTRRSMAASPLPEPERTSLYDTERAERPAPADPEQLERAGAELVRLLSGGKLRGRRGRQRRGLALPGASTHPSRAGATIGRMFDPKTMLLCHSLGDLIPRLEDPAARSAGWHEARAAIEALQDDDEDARGAVEAEDAAALSALVSSWASGERLLPVQDRGLLKRALKSFRKRLKLLRLDEESRIGGAFSTGMNSSVVALTPPDQYPTRIWEQLAQQGRLIDAKHGMYELPPD